MLKDPKLSSDEIEYLSNKYDTKYNTTVNYREFISSVIKCKIISNKLHKL